MSSSAAPPGSPPRGPRGGVLQRAGVQWSRNIQLCSDIRIGGRRWEKKVPMRDFGDKVWTPAGSRPHAYITLSPQLDELCEALIGQDGPLRQWRPDSREITRPVERRFPHVTLSWADIPTVQAPAGSWDALAAALTETTAGIAPPSLTLSRLETTSAGVGVDRCRCTAAGGHRHLRCEPGCRGDTGTERTIVLNTRTSPRARRRA